MIVLRAAIFTTLQTFYIFPPKINPPYACAVHFPFFTPQLPACRFPAPAAGDEQPHPA